MKPGQIFTRDGLRYEFLGIGRRGLRVRSVATAEIIYLPVAVVNEVAAEQKTVERERRKRREQAQKDLDQAQKDAEREKQKRLEQRLREYERLKAEADELIQIHPALRQLAIDYGHSAPTRYSIPDGLEHGGSLSIEWDSEVPLGIVISMEHIAWFDTIGMRRVYWRRDDFGNKMFVNMDVWLNRDDRLLARFWSGNAEMDGRCIDVIGIPSNAIPDRSAMTGFSDTWIPEALRQEYEDWLKEVR